MRKGQEQFDKTKYVWLQLGESSTDLRVGINPEKGIRVVSSQAAFEIPIRYAVAQSIVSRLKTRDLEGVNNELSFMMSVIQMFSDEKMRNLFFAMVDMNYFLITNAKDYTPFDFKGIDPAKNPQEFLEEQLESVKHFNSIRDKALTPLDEVFEVLTKIKAKVEADKKDVEKEG